MAAESISAGRLHELEADIPVREGDYGDRVMAVEPGGIEYIALEERHGTPRQLFWTWNSPNWEFATMFLGVIPIVVFGGGFWPTVAAGIVVSIPFWNQSLWHGPVVDVVPQLGDLSFIVGFVVAAGVYFALAGKSATEAAAATAVSA